MKTKMLAIFIINLLILPCWLKPVLALEHAQKDGLFKIDVPGEWRWFESSEEVLITYPDGKTVAMDIQMVPSVHLSQADIDKTLKQDIDKMVKQGIEAHHGVLVDDKKVKLDGVSAERLDFETGSPNPLLVTYVAFFTKDYAFTITYGSEDGKMHAVMDDTLETIKFK